MAYAPATYTGNGSLTDYLIVNPYQQEADIECYLDGVETTLFTFLSATTVRFDTAPANGVAISVKRNTPTVRRVNYTDGGNLTENKLDKDSTQLQYIVEEASYSLNTTIQVTASDTFDALSKKIENLLNPTADQDAATKKFVDDAIAAAVLGTLEGVDLTGGLGVTGDVTVIGGDLVLPDDRSILSTTGTLKMTLNETDDRFNWDIGGVNVMALDDVGNRLVVTASDDGSAFALQRSGTAAATNDIAISYQLTNDAAENVVFGRIQVNSEVVGDGIEVGSMEILVMEAGTLTRFMDLDASSTPPKVRIDKMLQPNGGIALGDESELTISGGSITPTSSSHTVDTQADAGSDILDTIDDANISSNGTLLMLHAENTARSVIVTHSASGNHKIVLADGVNYTLDDDAKSITLRLQNGEWHEVARSTAAVASGFPTPDFVGTDTAIDVDTTFVHAEAHSLGAVPTHFDAVLVCTGAELGYSVGDIILINDHQGQNQAGFGVVADATNITFLAGDNALRLNNKTTGANAAAALTGTVVDNFKVRNRAWS